MTDRDLFIAALEQPEGERQAWLDRFCADDPDLRRRLDVLLRAHEMASQFLASPAVEQFGDQAAPNGSTRSVDPAKEAYDDTADVLALLAPAEKPGQLGKLAHYEVMEVVGRGAMGVVVKAFDPKLHRVVAIKLMARHLAANAAARRRFEREARAVAAVRNEHVVAIHGVEPVAPLPYLVMEFIGGISLQDQLDQRGPLEVKQILRIGMQAAQGLAAAHAQGLVHRDVKPANILLENGVECVKITDFGLARAVDDVNLTQSGVITGTPNYMSPEQADGRTVDHRSDLFSLGSVLYALATGHPPFRASGMAGVLKRVAADTPRPVREINPDVPDWLEAIIAKLHAKDPTERFQSAKEVAELLGQHLAHLQQPGQVPRPQRVAAAPTPAVAAAIPLIPFLLVLFTFASVVMMVVTAVELSESPNPSLGAIAPGVLMPLSTLVFFVAWRRQAPVKAAPVAATANPSLSWALRRGLLALLSGGVVMAAVIFVHNLIDPHAPHEPPLPEAGMLAVLGLLWLWVFWWRPAAVAAPASAKGSSLPRDLGATLLVVGFACVVGWVAVAHLVIAPPQGMQQFAPSTEVGVRFLFLVPVAVTVFAVAFWFWRRRSREGRPGRRGRLALLLLVPVLCFGALRYFGRAGVALEMPAWVGSNKAAHPPHPEPPRPPISHLSVVKDDPAAEVTVTCNGERIVHSAAGGRGNNGHQILPNTPAVLVIRKGGALVHEEVLRLRLGESRQVRIPTIVSPAETVRLVPTAGSFPADVTRMQLAPDRSAVAVERLDGPIVVFDVASGKERFTVARPKGDCTAFGFTPDGKHLAYLTRADDGDTVLRVADARDGSAHGKDLKPTTGYFANAHALAFSPDGKRLAVSTAYTPLDGGAFQAIVHRWEWPDRKELPTIADGGAGTGVVEAMRFRQDGAEVLGVTDSQRKVQWNWDAGKTSADWWLADDGLALDLVATAKSPTGSSAVFAGWKEATRTASLHVRLLLNEGHFRDEPAGAVRLGSLALSDDGAVIAAGNKGIGNAGWDHRASVRLWDAKGGKEKAVLLGHADWILDVAFTPDGKQLVSASKDGTVRRWNLPAMAQ